MLIDCASESDFDIERLKDIILNVVFILGILALIVVLQGHYQSKVYDTKKLDALIKQLKNDERAKPVRKVRPPRRD